MLAKLYGNTWRFVAFVNRCYPIVRVNLEEHNGSSAAKHLHQVDADEAILLLDSMRTKDWTCLKFRPGSNGSVRMQSLHAAGMGR